jgi:hypothetical protein
MLTGQTFPSNWESKNANKVGKYADTSLGRDAISFMTGYQNPLHNQAMIEARQRTLDKAKDEKARLLRLQHNGYWGLAPKAMPQGSFNRPFTSSGDIGYGDNANKFGGARTPVGQEWVRGLLKKRGKELAEMAASQETGIGLDSINTDTISTIPATQSEAVETSLDLLIDNITSQFYSGEFENMRVAEITQVYNKLLEEGKILPKDKLDKYYNIFIRVRETIEQLLASNDAALSQRLIYLMPQNVGLMFFKISVLIRVLISVRDNYTDKEQQRIVRDLSKLILKTKNRTQLLKLEQDIYARFEKIGPPEIPVMARVEALDEAKKIDKATKTRMRVKKTSEEGLTPGQQMTLENYKDTVESIKDKIRNEEVRLHQLSSTPLPRNLGERAAKEFEISDTRGRIDAFGATLQEYRQRIQELKRQSIQLPAREEFVYG